MKAPIKWLKDYVDIKVSLDELAQKLLSVGFEVEEIVYLGEGIDRVVVGKILSLKKHENADKLQVCSIDVGGAQPLQIVTGANNIAVGDCIPVALDGSTLPGGKKIVSGELRGVQSEGMLCSGSELGLTNADYQNAEAHGILILEKGKYKLGEDIKKTLGLDEYVLDVSITANRPDCQSIYGLAREVAAVLGAKLKPLDVSFTPSKTVKTAERISVKIADDELCPTYIAGYCYDVKVDHSAKFIAERLRLCGLRPINNVVDVTNFVLLELGQPMHAFDQRKLSGDRLTVRRAEEGERVTALDGAEYTLNGDMLAICDGAGIAAIAGIMGGERTKTDENSTDIIFESAVFNRQNIRRNSRILNLRSDSSAMFERGVSIWSAVTASKRSLHLIEKFGIGKIADGFSTDGVIKPKNRMMKVPCKKIDDVLGIRIKPNAMVKILNSLNMQTAEAEGVLCVSIPPYRTDIDRSADIAEEIIRMYGYDNIMGTLLADATVTNGRYGTRQKNTIKIENALVANGANEIITYSFTGKTAYDNINADASKCIRLLNPLGEELSLMRTQLASSMLGALGFNYRKGNKSAKLFENAAVYMADALPITQLPTEKQHLSIGAYGDSEDFYSMKGTVVAALRAFSDDIKIRCAVQPHMHPGRCAEVLVNDKICGYFGEVHPVVSEKFGLACRVYLAEIDLSRFIDAEKAQIVYKNIPKFVGIQRDIALVVGKNTTHERIVEVISDAGGDIVEAVQLFDVYRDASLGDKCSMAYTISFRSAERTLLDTEVNAVMEKILQALNLELGITLRS